MNVNELYLSLEQTGLSADELVRLTIRNLDLSLKIDRLGNVKMIPRPSFGEGRAIVSYEDLWAGVSEDMFNNAELRISDIRMALEAQIMGTSKAIQKAINEFDFGGVISFWRSGYQWLKPQVHLGYGQRGKMVVFTDAFESGGTTRSFLSRDNLSEMPLDYQIEFISSFWPDFSELDAESVMLSDSLPPITDEEILAIGREKTGKCEGIWTLH